MQQTVTLRAIIKKDTTVLLLRLRQPVSGNQQLYELPGGILRPEAPPDSLKATLHEQLGQSATTVELHDLIAYQSPAHAGEQHVVGVYTATINEEAIRLNDSYDHFEWVEMSKIHQQSLTRATRAVLGLSLENIVPEAKTRPEESIEDKKTTQQVTAPFVFAYSDGGSRGNPGPSASGFVILDDKKELLFEGGKYLGITTNNQAEYQAVKLALEKALELGARRVDFRLDSLLVVNQLSGIYQIRNRDLWPIHAAIKELAAQFEKITFTHVRREFNKEADAMVNKILDQHTR